MSAAAGLLSGMHAIIALRRNEPHWMLSEADAKRYGAALSNALRHLPVHATQKALDFGVLTFMIFEMETPRVVKSLALARQQKAGFPSPAARGPAKIFEFAPPGTPQPNGPPPSANSGSPAPGAPPIADPPRDAIGGDGETLQ
jgi:hypothetical protein